MYYFYSQKISKDMIVLEDQEMLHCVKVLRNKLGDNICVVDGLGNLFYTEIVNILSKECHLKILSSESIQKKIKVHLLISPTKNHKRIEWMIEKIVEIGVERVTFLICKNSIRKSINLTRLNKIALSAMKQTQNAFLPQIDDCISFQDIFSIVSSKEKYIAHLNRKNILYLSSVLQHQNSRCILIGPEGDFTEEEVINAVNNGFKEVSLGNSRLRTETSGIVSTTILNL